MVAAVSRFAGRNAVGLLALFVALGGTSYAVTAKKTKLVGRDGVVHACVVTRTGAVRLVKKGKHCRKGTQALAWSQKGPRGVRGLAGAKGEAGSPGPAGSIQGAPAGGDLVGSYPAPTIAPASPPIEVKANAGTGSDPCAGPVPTTGVFCGAGAARWNPGSYAAAGVQFWRDRLGEVHVRGEAASFDPANARGLLFVLPPGFRPAVFASFPIAVAHAAGIFTGAPVLLIVSPKGEVSLLAATLPTGSTEVFFGEIQFRTDG